MNTPAAYETHGDTPDSGSVSTGWAGYRVRLIMMSQNQDATTTRHTKNCTMSQSPACSQEGNQHVIGLAALHRSVPE